MTAPAEQVTMLLEGVGRGDQNATARLMDIVYGQLRALAASCWAQQRPDQTLQPTALVHEAFVKLVQSPSARFNDRTHFFAVAAAGRRQLLHNHAGAERAIKRARHWERVSIDVAIIPTDDNQLDL